MTKTGVPVKTFDAGLVVKLTRDVPAGAGSAILPAGTILVIQKPFETTDTAGWSYTPEGHCVAVHNYEATPWDFGAFDR